MVVSESEIVSQGGENGESQFQQDQQQNKNTGFSSIGRQSSIYSLTLDEFQSTICEGGKNFGSMNMDEFLNSIWTAEENQAINNGGSNNGSGTNNGCGANGNNNHESGGVNSSHGEVEVSSHDQKGIVKQPSLARQGSLTIPPPLCRKTVDEVWSEIHQGSQQGRQQSSGGSGAGSGGGGVHNTNSNSAPRQQPTFGEMTLEDFLVKAGVVREQSATPPVPPPPPASLPQQYGFMGGPPFSTRAPIMLAMDPSGGGGGKKSGCYHVQQPGCYNGRMGNGGGYGPPVQSMGMDNAGSPVSPDGIGTGLVDNGANQCGIEFGGSRGRKRGPADGPVEKVVERRQKRMIKNRESAARSRARKQAYTVELEAELNQLRDENAHLKQTLADMEMKRKQQHFEEVKMRSQTKAQKAREKLKTLRRTLSCPL